MGHSNRRGGGGRGQGDGGRRNGRISLRPRLLVIPGVGQMAETEIGKILARGDTGGGGGRGIPERMES